MPEPGWMPDVVAALGLGLMVGGVTWWLHPGAGLALAGVVLVALGIRGAWR